MLFWALWIPVYSPFGLNMSIALLAKAGKTGSSLLFGYKLKRTQPRVQFPEVEQVFSRPGRMSIELYSISFLCNLGPFSRKDE